jgi:hypothetical protein
VDCCARLCLGPADSLAFNAARQVGGRYG